MRLITRPRLLFLAAGIAAGLAVGYGIPTAGADVVGVNVSLPSPVISFDQAQAAAPYRIRTLSDPNLSLFMVNWVSDPESPGVVSVGLWYRTGDGQSVHLWQTNGSFAKAPGKDPTTFGSKVTIAQADWQEVMLQNGLGKSALSRRFSDGITVSADGTVDPSQLRSLMPSIHQQ